MSTTDVCRSTGATYRQVDHWCRKGYIDGVGSWVGSGHRRRFTRDQVGRVQALIRASQIKELPLDELADLLTHS